MGSTSLKNIPELRRALAAYGAAADKAIMTALREAARYGVAATLQTSAKTNPRPKASGTHERGWHSVKLRDGAAVTNSAKHAIFVEAGRKPGNPPPRDAILEWVYQKRLVKRSGAERRSKRTGVFTAGALRKQDEAKAIAIRIQRKIAMKGTKGRWVLRRSMPAIAKRAKIEINRRIGRLAKDPPR